MKDNRVLVKGKTGAIYCAIPFKTKIDGRKPPGEYMVGSELTISEIKNFVCGDKNNFKLCGFDFAYDTILPLTELSQEQIEFFINL